MHSEATSLLIFKDRQWMQVSGITLFHLHFNHLGMIFKNFYNLECLLELEDHDFQHLLRCDFCRILLALVSSNQCMTLIKFPLLFHPHQNVQSVCPLCNEIYCDVCASLPLFWVVTHDRWLGSFKFFQYFKKCTKFRF